MYSEAFLTTLHPTGRAVLQRGARNVGAIPLDVVPAISGAVSAGGMTLDAGGATPASTATVLPITGGTEPEHYLHVLRTSGDGSSETAGFFGLPTVGMLFCASAGYALHWCTAGSLTTAGRGGDLLGEDFAADDSFEPDRVVGGFGWVKHSGEEAEWVWYGGTPDETEPCTGEAPADGRRYSHVIAVAAGATTGYALKVDLSDPAAPVIADQRTFTIPNPNGPKGFELNRSPGPAGSGQTPVALRLYWIEGSCGVIRF